MAFIDRLLSYAGGVFGRPEPKAVPGVPPTESRAPVAPWPLVDRYPIILGANLSFQSIANVMRLAQTGYRQQMVDLLAEQLEREPHGFAVLSQRILAVAGGRVEIFPAKTPDGDDAAKLRAKEISEEVDTIIHAIPDLKQSVASLLWAVYYGVSAAEISWNNDSGVWKPVRLHMVHSRRLAYPDHTSWTLHIWDQGMVRGWGDLPDHPTNGLFGLRVDDYPGKFIVHTPKLRGEYPTREGLGRELSYWFAMKALGARGAAQYVERFAKPWPVAYWTTSDKGTPRAADDEDIAKADAATRALGAGSLAGATLPDCVKIDLLGPGHSGTKTNMSHAEFVDMCNAEISKAVQGQTFTTEPGKFGSKGTAESGKSNTLQIAAYDAGCLADTLKRDLVFWIVKLNWPEEIHLCPNVVIRVEGEPDATELVERAAKAAAAGVPVDADALADMIGLPVVPRAEGDVMPRRMAPVKSVGLSELTGSSTADALAEAARVDAAGIPSPTFKRAFKAKLAKRLIGDDTSLHSTIEKEIGDGIASEEEIGNILRENLRGADDSDGDEDDEQLDAAE